MLLGLPFEVGHANLLTGQRRPHHELGSHALPGAVNRQSDVRPVQPRRRPLHRVPPHPQAPVAVVAVARTFRNVRTRTVVKVKVARVGHAHGLGAHDAAGRAGHPEGEVLHAGAGLLGQLGDGLVGPGQVDPAPGDGAEALGVGFASGKGSIAHVTLEKSS